MQNSFRYIGVTGKRPETRKHSSRLERKTTKPTDWGAVGQSTAQIVHLNVEQRTPERQHCIAGVVVQSCAQCDSTVGLGYKKKNSKRGKRQKRRWKEEKQEDEKEEERKEEQDSRYLIYPLRPRLMVTICNQMPTLVHTRSEICNFD